MQILYVILVLLVVTRTCGELAARVGQAALAGELVGGIALGILVGQTDLFPVLEGLPSNEVFAAITDLGVFFLMLLGGLELRPRDLARASGTAIQVAVGGMVVPLALGLGVAWLFLPDSDLRLAQALFIGTALAITAVPVSVKVLMDLGKLQSKPGAVIVSAAVFDDVLSLVILALLISMIESGQPPSGGEFALLGGKVVVFFAITFVVGHWILPRLWKIIRRALVAELEFTFLLVFALGAALLAEVLGLHFIIGAFIAGLLFTRRTNDDRTYGAVRERVSAITTGFLAPIFFASIGLHVSIDSITGAPAFLLVLLAIAFAGKLLGSGLPALWSGLSMRESVAVGFGMSGRGAVELIIADIALRSGLFEQPQPVPPVVEHLFSTIVLIAIVTTLAAPLALRLSLGTERRAE